ncbi:zincin [Martensiomyces pterosporus]|nr:zincin [Martensiomyces pterosporus]
MSARPEPLDFSQFTPGYINSATDAIISSSQRAQDEVAAQTQPTFANVIAPLAMSENDASIGSTLCFLQILHPDSAVRDASTRAQERLSRFETASGMRDDVYQVVRAVGENEQEMAQLSAEDRRLVERIERQFRRNGLALDAGKREQLGDLRKQITELCIKFSRNLTELDGEELFTRGELEGLPASFLEGREAKTVDGVEKYVVTTKYPDLFPVLRLAKSRETRKRLFIANDQRCKENVNLLQQAIRLRLDAAKLLGYATHAEYVLGERMAKTPEAVGEFEASLLDKLNTVADREIADIFALREKLEHGQGDQSRKVLYAWDYPYYANLIKEQKYNVDDEQVKEYFPTKLVTRRILDFYEHLLHARISKAENAPVWHPSVDAYEVWDASSAGNEPQFVGYFYLDLYPRQGKENHPCTLTLRPGYTKRDGSREYPNATLIANYSVATDSKPSLLTHNDARILLHELGHVFHHIFAYSKWAQLQMATVEFDFIEAPSQMLENWVWQPTVLKQLASHYDTNEPIPDALVSAIVASKNADTGMDSLRRMYHSSFDRAIHNATEVDSIDVQKLFLNARRDIGRLDTGDVETAGAGVFGHVMQGYDAGFYVYMWGQVFSADMFAERFGKEGINNRQTGLDYRNQILRPGATRDAAVSLEEFLGREPKPDAFFESLGL